MDGRFVGPLHNLTKHLAELVVCARLNIFLERKILIFERDVCDLKLGDQVLQPPVLGHETLDARLLLRERTFVEAPYRHPPLPKNEFSGARIASAGMNS